MKRSEMIALLAEDLSENHGLDFLTDYPEVVASKILDLLESKGMLPPPIYGEQYSECPENNWEPEGD